MEIREIRTAQERRWLYVFDVDGQEVPVEVDWKIMTLWDVSTDQIKRGTELLIDDAIDSGRPLRGQVGLVLNEYAARPIARKLGWKFKG